MGDVAENLASLLEHLEIRKVPHRRSVEEDLDEASGSPLPLPDIPMGCEVRLAANHIQGLLRQRLIDLGFTSGATLRLVRRGPKGNLIAVSIRDTIIALRCEEARSLFVTYDVHTGE